MRADHVHALYARKLESGLSARTVQIAHRILRAALKDAVRWNLVPRNVVDAVNAPKPQRKEMKVWTPAEAARLLKLSRSQVYLLCQRREIPTITIGRAVRVPLRELEEWLRRQVQVIA